MKASIKLVGVAMTDNDYIAEFEKHLKAASKSPSTIESYCRDSKDFLQFIENLGLVIGEVEPETLVAYSNYLNDRDRENSVRRKIIAIRQFFRFLSEFQQTYESPLDFVPIPERDESLPDGLLNEDIDEIIAVIDSKPSGIKAFRDKAIFFLLAFEGIKANELIKLKWSNIYTSHHTSTLQLQGSKPRTIELSKQSSVAIQKYQIVFDEKLKSFIPEKDLLFVSFKGRDFATVLPQLSRHGLKFLLYEIGESVGIKHLNTELLRHYAIQYQLNLGKTPSEIMAHFGLKRMGNIAKHVHSIKNLNRAEKIE